MAFDFTEIFGTSESMTKDQLVDALSQKGIKLGDLSTGKYVDSSKYQSVATELENLKRENMTAEQKAQADLDAIKQLNESLIRDRTRGKVESMFAKNGMNPDNYDKLINKFAELKEEDAIASAQSIIDNFNTEKTAMETQIRQQLMQGMKQPDGASGGSPQTKKFSEMTMEERIELKKSNPELYNAEIQKIKKF